MKYIDKFPDMKPIFDECEGIIRGRSNTPCCVCGQSTEYVETNYQAPFCSEECVAEMDSMSFRAGGYGMNERRIPFENDVPKHKKKSKKKGQPRADHKHEYKTVLLHSYFDNPFKPGEKNECKRPTKICMICGRVGDTDLTQYDLEEIPDMPYRIQRRVIKDEELLERWYVDDYFSKFAYKR